MPDGAENLRLQDGMLSFPKEYYAHRQNGDDLDGRCYVEQIGTLRVPSTFTAVMVTIIAMATAFMFQGESCMNSPR